MRFCGEGDEGEGELALEGVGDAYYASFGDLRVGGDCLFDAALKSIQLAT